MFEVQPDDILASTEYDPAYDQQYADQEEVSGGSPTSGGPPVVPPPPPQPTQQPSGLSGGSRDSVIDPNVFVFSARGPPPVPSSAGTGQPAPVSAAQPAIPAQRSTPQQSPPVASPSSIGTDQLSVSPGQPAAPVQPTPQPPAAVSSPAAPVTTSPSIPVTPRITTSQGVFSFT